MLNLFKIRRNYFNEIWMNFNFKFALTAQKLVKYNFVLNFLIQKSTPIFSTYLSKGVEYLESPLLTPKKDKSEKLTTTAHERTNKNGKFRCFSLSLSTHRLRDIWFNSGAWFSSSTYSAGEVSGKKRCSDSLVPSW